MWNTWLANSTLPALEQSAMFTERRHNLLAGNIANMDTPDYKTRDISTTEFQDALDEAIHQPHTSTAQSGPGPAHQPDVMQRVRDVGKQILYHDNSDVSLEEQVTEITKNQSKHNTAVALMRSQMQTLQVAIRESVAI